jgi:hypothetical protein
VIGMAQPAGFLHHGQSRRRAAAVNMPPHPTLPTRLDRGEHRYTIQGGGTPPTTSKINNRLHRKLDNLGRSASRNHRPGEVPLGRSGWSGAVIPFAKLVRLTLTQVRKYKAKHPRHRPVEPVFMHDRSRRHKLSKYSLVRMTTSCKSSRYLHLT